MIEKIDIKNFGSFRNYEWKKSVGNDQHSIFKPINIIYGRNYAGKTTLSRIFRSIETKELHEDFISPGFNLKFKNGTEITEENLANSLGEYNVRVYNTDFVKANLSWFNNDDGVIVPFAILGEKNVEIEKELHELKQILGNVDDKKGLLFERYELHEQYNSVDSEVRKTTDELDELLRSKAREIRNTGDIYNVPNYNIASIKSEIDRITGHSKLSSGKIDSLKKLLKEGARGNISKMNIVNADISILVQTTNELLTRKISPSEPIIDLINNRLLQEWVREGIIQHKGKRDRCGFCDNPIDSDLWLKLDEHFNKESENIRTEINSHINTLTEFRKEISNYFILDKSEFYIDIEPKVNDLNEGFNIVKNNILNDIDSLVTALKERSEDVFLEKSAIIIGNSFEVFNGKISEFNKLIEENNLRTLSLSTDQEIARSKLREDEILKFIEVIRFKENNINIERLEGEKEKVIPIITQIDTNINDTKMKIKELENQMEDESKGAELVNEYLGNFFGHSELKLVSEGEKPNISFKILRDGEQAKNLSEGETSLISFCYFIAQIEDELKSENSSEEIIIYIDDPISSLDGNHIYFMFGLIESVIAKGKNYLQLFISTHNMDFLKYLNRITLPDGSKENINHFLIERRMKKDDGASFLVGMPDHMRKYVTEFNYLFNEIYSVYKEVRGDRKKRLENTYNTFYNLPNNIRKFLEAYLFYKYPNNENPLNNLDKLFDGNVPVIINRVINEYSHLVYIDRGWKPIDVQEIEICVDVIIEKIKSNDPEQFNALLESIGEPPIETVVDVATKMVAATIE